MNKARMMAHQAMVVCFLVLTLSAGMVVAQDVGPDSLYYQKRTQLIGYPPYRLSPGDRSRLSRIEDLHQTWRIASYLYDAITPAEALKKAEEFKATGFNLILSEGNRYLFRDRKPLKSSSAIHAAPFEELIRNTRVMSDACHKAGLKFFLHTTCTMVDAGLLDDHPDWQAIDMATGKTITNGYGTGNSCISNDDFMKAFYVRLERFIRETNPDGIMQDEIQFFSETLCGCHWCREKFKKATGYTMPATSAGWVYHTEIPSYSAWLEWRRAEVVDHMQRVQAMIKKSNPSNMSLAYMNNTGAGHYYYAGWVMDDMPRFVDGVGMECEPPDMLYFYYWPTVIFETKYLRAIAEDMNTAPWILFYDRFGDNTWNWFLAMSQGARLWWFTGDPAANVCWEPLLAWEEKHEKILMNVRTASNIGVFFSLDTRDRTHKDWSEKTWIHGFAATCNALTDMHVPYRVVLEADMTPEVLRQKGIDTLILFDAGGLSDNLTAVVKAFVKDGGTLIAGGDTSLYDEHGRVRPDFALADLYGFGMAGESRGKNSLVIPEGNSVTGDMTGRFPHDYSFYLLKGLSPDVQTVGWMELPDGKKQPGILTRSVGKGKVVYFAGHPAFHYFFYYYGVNTLTPGQPWTDHRDERYGRLLARVAGCGGDKVPMVAENLPRGVVAEVYSHEAGGLKGVQVHLVNFLGGWTRTGMIPPVYSVTFPEVKPRLPDPTKPITLAVRAQGVKKVYLISPDFDAIVSLPFTAEGDRCTVSLPSFYRYSIVYFSQGDDRDILRLGGGKAAEAIPAAKKLVVEEKEPLAGRYDPHAAIVFADSPQLRGGVDRGWFKKEPVVYLYGTRSPYPAASVELDLKAVPARPVLQIGAMDDNRPSSHCPLEIKVNGKIVFRGNSTYPDQEWAVKDFPLTPADLRVGKNVVEIKNTGNSTKGNIPWFGISFVRIVAR